MTDERLREIAKKHARNAIAPIGSREHANRTDPVVMQGMVRAEEVIFYALKEAFALPEALRSGETPRTDAAIELHRQQKWMDYDEMTEHARQLERELAEVTEHGTKAEHAAIGLANRWMKAALDMAPNSTMTMAFLPDCPEAFAASRVPVIHALEKAAETIPSPLARSQEKADG